MSSFRHFVWYWGPVLAWAGLIFWSSHQPTLPGPEDYWVNFIIKKALHIFTFGVLAWLIFRADVRSRKDWCTTLGVAFWSAVAYAAFDEIHQIFVPGREATIRDFLIDALGIFLVLAFIKRKQKSPGI